MSDKERSLVENIAALPPALQEKFLYQAQGAALAVETLGVGKDEKEAASE